MDLRTQKTYNALMTSFSELLKKKRFEKITVNEICDNAMVRRATFYKHFADKYELFAFMIKDIQTKYNSQASDEGSPNKGKEQYIAIASHMLTFLEENEELVSSVMRSDLYPAMFNILFKQIAIDVKNRMNNDVSDGQSFSIYTDLMAETFTGALLSISVWWIANRKPITKEETISQISILLSKLYEE